jgi:hypothetical protein
MYCAYLTTFSSVPSLRTSPPFHQGKIDDFMPSIVIYVFFVYVEFSHIISKAYVTVYSLR